MIINGAGLPSRVIVPMLADRFGPLNAISISMVIVGIVIACWLAVSDRAGLYVFTTACGLASGAVQSLMPTTIASITKRLDTVGTRLGMVFSILSFSSLTGPPIGGAISQAAGGSYTEAQIWAGVVGVLGGALAMVARFSKVGWKIKAKC